MTTGAVHSYDVSIGVDGPGTRFVAFLAGCPLRCQFCHSPDTWFRRAGTPTTDDALVAQVLRYQRFISVAGGGVTLSGGEPLMQPDFVRAVLRRCHDAGLHTALDTSGFLGARADDDLLDATDLVLLDIKSSDPLTYRRVTRTGRLDPTLRFARRLADRGTPIWVRFVLVPGLTDAEANVAGVAEVAAGLPTVQRVDVLPFHRLGAHKYTELGLDYPLAATAPPDDARLDRVRGQFRARGLTVY
ncbi:MULTISPECIES: pyruvate formate-lyase-activating protein [unclassified Solwaraspora]|uniref:pyruvate formate-lyase-activating protein n=1 Tax=unclassified Solwaraspora TaxID=2627926 RepID=UPI00248CB918|nr:MULTISPECIES: pyruvate formate-lyase-activating protein [unclassified Solwaraspora]WBB98830.1 pyruvate formate-lyase-activating protein [Solwaraspora sp. WMMA2059]WJK35333.1 pyruvate formate-lyase-activating protein [Solwaraspora sp. WMMA2065]